MCFLCKLSDSFCYQEISSIMNDEFLVAEQLYTHPCVFVCVSPVLCVPCLEAWMKPDSDQLYSGVQTDDRATILEPHAKKDSAQTKGVHVCNSIFNENFTFSSKESPWDYVNIIKITWATVL